jgi:hypothetical protein
MNSPGFSADLTSFDLLDLVQVVHLDRHDLCLVLRAGQQTLGVLRFRQGELLWAEFGEITGEAAFLALAAQQYGNLEQLPWTDTGERNVYQPLSRLIMQAVAYREQQWRPEGGDAWSDEGWGQPQEANEPLPPLPGRPGNGSQRYLDSRPATTGAGAEDMDVPDWVRHVRPSVDEIAAQPTGAMPLPPILVGPEKPPAAPSPRSPSMIHTPPPLPVVPTGEQPSQPTGAFSMLNGKRGLPGLPRGTPRNGAAPAGPAPEDPPTVPLPSVQGNLMEYALRRDQPAVVPVEEQGTKPLLGSEPVPEEGAMTGSATGILTALASAGSLALPAASAGVPAAKGASASGLLPGEQVEGLQERISTAVPSAPVAAGPQPATSGPGEAKPSSLSLLEQLAYGSALSAYSAEAAAPALAFNGTAAPPPAAVVNDAALAASAPAAAAPPPNEAAPEGSGRPISRHLSDPASRRSLVAGPEPAGSSSAAPGAEAAGGALVWPLSAETTRKLQEALEGFALQVGAAFLATAILRANGEVAAQHMANKRVEQDLSSAAYHLAHVMQSSLRALLMGGWGDLDETLITGSTHTVVLRRLGWAEKGLFHMAVLERSGNHGLCRVLMRNTEPTLLSLLAPR